MGKLRWYKRDPNAALEGMMGLTLEERGAYNTLLDLIYSHEGSFPDDASVITRWLGCDPRVWRRIRTALINSGKLYIHGGRLRNQRADLETEYGLSRIASSAKAGLASAAVRRQTLEILKGGINERSTPVELPTPTSTKILSYRHPPYKK